MSFCPVSRAFAKGDVVRMDEEIIKRWNRTVTPQDHTYILGDFAFCNAEKAIQHLQRLNGKKTLIIGNHDTKLIKNEESILLMAPISGKRFVKNEKMGIYVILEGRSVKVINHIYSYSVVLSEKTQNKLISFYDDEIEKRRIEFEKEITANTKHSLKNILVEIDEKF